VNVITGKTSPDGSETSLTFMLRVVNSGAPSIAWKWHAKVQIASGQSIEAQADENPQILKNMAGKQMPELDFSAEKYLPNILLESPLPNGYGKLGWVFFRFNNISFDDLGRIGNKFTVQFEDSEGKVTSSSLTLDHTIMVN
jgi:hypothetical protein